MAQQSTRGLVLAKSLHTITVLQNLALHISRTTRRNVPNNKHEARACVNEALLILQLQDKPDVYCLAKIAAEHVAEQLTKAQTE